LVVDDDADAGSMLRLVLGERGAQATVVGSYEEALQALGDAAFDLLISDIGMPGKDGYDLVRELRRQESTQPGGLTERSIDVSRTECIHSDRRVNWSRLVRWNVVCLRRRGTRKGVVRMSPLRRKRPSKLMDRGFRSIVCRSIDALVADMATHTGDQNHAS
ncbi:MAG: response regulator, partial [Oxalobacteraceae bacterium]